VLFGFSSIGSFFEMKTFINSTIVYIFKKMCGTKFVVGSRPSLVAAYSELKQ